MRARQIIVVLTLVTCIVCDMRPRSADTEYGYLCVSTIQPSVEYSPGSSHDEKTIYYISIDKAGKQAIPRGNDGLLIKLSIQGSHLIETYDSVKRLATFRLNFAKYKTNKVCLEFNSFYESWHLVPMKQKGAFSCQCG